jgi:hypothetical protein
MRKTSYAVTFLLVSVILAVVSPYFPSFDYRIVINHIHIFIMSYRISFLSPAPTGTVTHSSDDHVIISDLSCVILPG